VPDAIGHSLNVFFSEESLSASVNAFDDILSGSLHSFLALSAKIGGDVSAQGKMAEQAFGLQRQFLVAASKSRQPGQSDLPMLLKPTADKIAEIQSFREVNRRSPFFNHLSALSESIPALGWVAVVREWLLSAVCACSANRECLQSPAPAPFVKEMNDAGQFYTNRVLKDWKEKDKVHAEWVKAWINTLGELQAYVKQFHTTGLVWNPKGVDATTILQAKFAQGGPPLPPPPPPPGLFDDIKSMQPNPENTVRNALFSELNKGEDVTKGTAE
jgi:adenylyl cyclase-associated protein